MKKVVHAFTFFNELDLLEYKLRVMGDVADYIVIVEGDRTFSGQPKPFHFIEALGRYQPWWNKLVYVQVTDFPETSNAWDRERHQRNCILRGLASISHRLFDDDLLILGDLDEIPDPRIMGMLKRGELVFPQSCHFRQHLYYYNLECRSRSDYSTLTLFNYRNLKLDLERMDLNDAMRQNLPRTELVMGWHLSFFGGVDQMKTKLRAYSHHDEFPIDTYTPSYIESCVRTHQNIFQGLEGFHHVPVEQNDYLPPHWETIRHLQTTSSSASSS